MGDFILMSQYFINIYKGIKALLGGMSLTLKHMNNKKELVATMQYPHEKWPMPERDIGFENSEYNLIRSRLHVDIDDCIAAIMPQPENRIPCRISLSGSFFWLVVDDKLWGMFRFNAGAARCPVNRASQCGWLQDKLHTTVGKTAKRVAFAARWMPGKMRKEARKRAALGVD